MELSFDIRGFLKPYGKNNIQAEQLKTEFVDPFEEESSRHQLFSQYLQYQAELIRLLADEKWKQWINGSFISNKTQPKDIDLVNLIAFETVERHEKELGTLLGETAKKNYGMDAYVLKVYPQNHQHHIRSQSDLLYWEHWFSHSKMNRRRQRFSKGFVELEF